jgi:hypothetical protein
MFKHLRYNSGLVSNLSKPYIQSDELDKYKAVTKKKSNWKTRASLSIHSAKRLRMRRLDFLEVTRKIHTGVIFEKLAEMGIVHKSQAVCDLFHPQL